MKLFGNQPISETKPNPDDVRAAVERLSESSTFIGSERLRDFLRYVVEEALNGRAEMIRAKTIAMDIYGSTPSEMSRRENVVRVDAGRLRRKLAEYYAKEGRSEQIVFDLPKGGYAPNIEYKCSATGSVTERQSRPAFSSPIYLYVGLIGAFVVAGVIVLTFLLKPDNTYARKVPAGELSKDERSAIFDASPRRLQAVNLAHNGRDLIFPAIEPARLEAALMIFKAAMEQDESYFGGHAGAAQVAATISLVTSNETQAEEMLDYARNQSDQAIRLAPNTGWSQSAKAWVLFAGGNWSKALEYSDRARRLAPNDVHVLEFVSLILLYSAEFEEVIALSESALAELDLDRSYVFQNAMGSAKFHIQDYSGAVTAFENTLAGGGPSGPVAVAYLMAAQQMLGNSAEAQDLLIKYAQNWPDRRIDLLVQRLFSDPVYGEQLTSAMISAGWEPGE